MGFEIPADIAALDEAALSEAIEAALAEANEFGDEIDDEGADRIVALADFVTAARTVQGERAASRAARDERLNAARQALSEQPTEEPAEEPAEEPEQPAEPEVPAEEPQKEREAVVASVAKAAAKAPKPQVPARPAASLTAAADVPGFPTGAPLNSLHDAGKAVMSRLRTITASSGGGHRYGRYGATVIRKQFDEKFIQGKQFRTDSELLNAAAQESRLSGGSLTAAGGWGAPSETLYDLCSLHTTEGLVDLPEVQIQHGGLNYTKGIDFDAIFNSVTGFWDQTEAVAEAGTEAKTSLRPDVPDFVDVRLDAVGLMVEAGLLLRVGWEEIIDQTIETALVAHQHKVSAKLIAKVQGYTGAAKNVPNGFGNALDILHVLEVVATGERHRIRMGVNQTLEVWLPHWVKPLIRADLAHRNGSELFAVSDAQIDGYFSARNLRVQWLYNYQPIQIDGTAGVAITYPDTVEAIMYPAGTYVKGTTDVLTLDTVYDSVNLKKNDYVALFVEEGVLVANPCYEGRRISLPLIATGSTAAQTAKATGLFNA
jgi:hypothetical protein